MYPTNTVFRVPLFLGRRQDAPAHAQPPGPHLDERAPGLGHHRAHERGGGLARGGSEVHALLHHRAGTLPLLYVVR